MHCSVTVHSTIALNECILIMYSIISFYQCVVSVHSTSVLTLLLLQYTVLQQSHDHIIPRWLFINLHNRHLLVHLKKEANWLQVRRKMQIGYQFKERSKLAANLEKEKINLPRLFA